MPLDEDDLKALEQLKASPACKKALLNPTNPDNKELLRNWLYEKTDADALSIPEIIEAAAADAFRPANERQQEEKSKPKGRPSKRVPSDEALVKAPYRFVELPDQIAQPTRQFDLDSPQPDTFSGTLDVTLVAETPLLIGGAQRNPDDGDEIVQPFQLGRDGPYAIPGATVRGMVRHACDIVGYAKLTKANLRHRFGLRDFTHAFYAQSDISRPKDVGSGFLHVRDATPEEIENNSPFVTVENTVFEITRCAKHWQHVPIEKLADVGISGTHSWSGKTPQQKYAAAGMRRGGTYDFTSRHQFQDMGTDDYNRSRAKPVESGGQEGMLVFSGPLPGKGKKRYEYAFFPGPQDSAPQPIPAAMSNLFISLNSKQGKVALEPEGSWRELRPVAHASRVPVFIVGKDPATDPNFFFGLTRLFKIPHKMSVGEVLRRSQAAHKPVWDGEGRYQPDFVENLFGYVAEPEGQREGQKPVSTNPAHVARKSRVSFGFFRLDEATPATVQGEEPMRLVLSAPKASFAPYYLRNFKGDREKDYSTAQNVGLAGRKAYFPRYQRPDTRGVLEQMNQTRAAQRQMLKGESGDVWSNMNFLVPDRRAGRAAPLAFRGQIKFHNCLAEEIGMVLFALTHGRAQGGDTTGPSRFMVGRAKALGAGQMRLDALEMKIRPTKEQESPAEPPDQAFFIEAFVQTMRAQVNPAYPQVPPVQQWRAMADPTHGEALSGRLDHGPLPTFKNVRDMTKTMPQGSDQPGFHRPVLLTIPANKG